MAISHVGHNHPATPAGRRACRAGAPTFDITTGVLDMGAAPVKAKKVTATDLGLDMGEIRMTGAVARRMARQAMKSENARIQPRRGGARVSIKSSGCVQAALHIDSHGGRCACGWVADKIAA